MATRNAIGFRHTEAVNPTTGETVQQLKVVYDSNEVIRLLVPDYTSIDELIEQLKAGKKADILKQVVFVADGEYGPYCKLTRATTLAEY